MIPSLPPIRPSRWQLAVIASLSAVATGAVITTALGRTPAQSAAMAALHHRPVVVRLSAPAPLTAPSSVAAAPLGPLDSSSAVPPAATPGPAAPSSAGGAQAGAATPAPASSTSVASGAVPSTAPSKPAAKVAHVFVIALSTPSYDAAFGPGSVAGYLNGTLRREGTLLGGYESLGQAELPDYLAMISGQPPNADTSSGCATYAEFPSGTTPTADGQLSAAGCVYPNTVLTIGDQVTAAGHIWKAYIGDMGATSCAHPNSNAVDDAPPPGAMSEYDTRHNPFIYFHSLLDLGGCASDDVSLDQLPADLRSRSRTPTYAFIAPDACLDASTSTCPTGEQPGLAGQDAFLRQWVPKIRHSAAFRHDGVLIVAFAPSGSDTTRTAPTPGQAIPTGALILSARTPRGKTVSTTYNAYSLLRSVEGLLGYEPLARAKSARSFVKDVLGRTS